MDKKFLFMNILKYSICMPVLIYISILLLFTTVFLSLPMLILTKEKVFFGDSLDIFFKAWRPIKEEFKDE